MSSFFKSSPSIRKDTVSVFVALSIIYASWIFKNNIYYVCTIRYYYMVNNVNNVRVVFRSDIDRWKDVSRSCMNGFCRTSNKEK